MQAAYKVLKGKHIAKGVRGIIIPATMAVYKECILRGYTEAFVDAGCIVSTPPAAPAWRLHGHFGGRGALCFHHQPQLCGPHGPRGLRGLTASPATAAASALTGYITDPREV